MSVKQVYIPNLTVSGTFVEEIGSAEDKVCYPGSLFSVDICLEDFDDPEDYHRVWIALTKATQKKLERLAAAANPEPRT